MVVLALLYGGVPAAHAQQEPERLERALEARDPVLLSLPAVAVYDPLRDDPRFDPFVGRVRQAMGIASERVPA